MQNPDSNEMAGHDQAAPHPGAPAPADGSAAGVAASTGAPAAAPAAAGEIDEIESGIVEALRTVFDPEIPVNIYELGLIYDLDVKPGGEVQIKMTLTSPACPVAGSLPGDVKSKAEGVAGVTSVDVELVWDPVWNPSMMSEAARLELGMF